MRLRDAIDTLWTDSGTTHVYGQPYETPDGATIITVARVRVRAKAAVPEQPDPTGGLLGVKAEAAGVFVVKGDDVKWWPAVDAGRIALLGETIGLVAVTLVGLAMLRRPPWPDLSHFCARRT